MESMEISYAAVVVAGIAGFAFGAAYYTVLSKQWVAATGKTEEQLKADFSKLIFVVTGVAQLAIAYGLARVVGFMGEASIANGVTAAILAWVCFVMATMVVNHGFGRAKRSLTMIDGGHWLGVLLVQGMVIGLL